MKHKKILTIIAYILTACVCVFIICSILYVGLHHMETPPIHPTVAGDMEKVNGDYNMTVVEASDFGLKLENVEVMVVNSSGNVIFRQTLNYLVHNESSNLIFYDKDESDSLSEGDVLTIKSNLADQAYELKLISVSEKTVVYSYLWGV